MGGSYFYYVSLQSILLPSSQLNGDVWQNSALDPDWTVLGDLDAILVLCGDAAGEDEAVKKSTAFQVRDETRFNVYLIISPSRA